LLVAPTRHCFVPHALNPMPPARAWHLGQGEQKPQPTRAVALCQDNTNLQCQIGYGVCTLCWISEFVLQLNKHKGFRQVATAKSKPVSKGLVWSPGLCKLVTLYNSPLRNDQDIATCSLDRTCKSRVCSSSRPLWLPSLDACCTHQPLRWQGSLMLFMHNSA